MKQIIVDIGSLCGGAFVGLFIGVMLQPALRQKMTMGERIKHVAALFAIVLFGGGGGVAGLTFLSDASAAGAYLIGLLPGAVMGFRYMEKHAFASRVARRVPPGQTGSLRTAITNPINTPAAVVVNILDGIAQDEDPEEDPEVYDMRLRIRGLSARDRELLRRWLEDGLVDFSEEEMERLKEILDRIDP